MPPAPAIVWFRQDLRLSDNAALYAAAESGCPIIALYVWDKEAAESWSLGQASRWWLRQSLQSLSQDLQSHGVQLLIRTGSNLEVLRGIISQTKASAVYWNRCYEPDAQVRDAHIEHTLVTQGTEVEIYNGSLLTEPGDVLNKSGKPFKVFTPYWRALQQQVGAPDTLPIPKTLGATQLPSDDLDVIPCDVDFKGYWRPGEKSAQDVLEAFCTTSIGDYSVQRDVPATTGTSRLSPYLHFGEISPRQVWDRVKALPAAEPYLRQLGWREFSYQLLHEFPLLPEEPLDVRFIRFSWRDDPKSLEAWKRGKTGYPIVDAGMRELYQTGWMHNRVRMIVASFLTKHLLIPWQQGEAWFWERLVDADLANNSASWQWVAGCGADAAPFFRIFNPTLQGERFDPEGAYVRHWVPELNGVPKRYIHQPWECPELERASVGVLLGKDYPHPIVDHKSARKRALDAFAAIKS